MGNGSNPPSLISISMTEDTLKQEGINLDLSSRKKIIIRPSTNKESTRIKVGTAEKKIILGISIFNRTSSMKKVQHTLPIPEAKSTDPRKEQRAKLASQRAATAAARTNFEENTTPQAEKFLTYKQATASHTTGTVEDYPMEIVDDDDVAPPTDTENDRVPVAPDEGVPSLYAEEYAKCGCTTNGGGACTGCKILKLTEKFCNTVKAKHNKFHMETAYP